jgi:hypothetical protein
MKKKLVIFTFGFAVLFLVAGCGSKSVFPPQSGTLVGYVYVQNFNESNAPERVMQVAGRVKPTGYDVVEGATVTIVDIPGISKITNSDGMFEFDKIIIGSHTVHVEKEGMKSPPDFTVTVAANEITTANDQTSSEITVKPTVTGILSVTAVADCDSSIPVKGTVYINGQASSYQTPTANISDIAPGVYDVYVVAKDYDKPATQTVTVTKEIPVTADFQLAYSGGNATPYATISTPVAGGSYTEGSSVALTGAGTDCEDGNLTGDSLVWKSSRDGTLGKGAALIVSNLSAGVHTITLTAIDSGGLKAKASVEITITKAAPNAAPVASLIMPADGAEFNAGATISFFGVGNDDEDGVLPTASVVWTSSRDEEIGTGNAFQRNDLSVGTHKITLTVTDSEGKTDTSSVSITVSKAGTDNTAPVAVIALPVDGITFQEGTNVYFAGTGIDTEDGNLIGDSLIWTASPGGLIGTGPTLQYSGLSVGKHTIALTVMDSGGMVDTAQVSITISAAAPENTAPTAVIASPAAVASRVSGIPVFFVGAGYDTEDITITGDSLVWTIEPDGVIQTGATFQKSDLSVGEHTITLIAIDSGGLTGSDTATLTITEAP